MSGVKGAKWGPISERLPRRLAPCPDQGCECLLFTGYLSKDGYGVIAVNGKTMGVHRAAWELENGPIPEGLTIDHVRARGCTHRHCCNPAHLEAVTNRENTLRGNTITAAAAAATHCVNGHEYDLINTYWRPDGSRDCRACKRRRAAASTT